MQGKKQHKTLARTRKRGDQCNVKFSGIILAYGNMQTGEGYSKIRELWAQQGAERLPKLGGEVNG